MLEEVGLPYEVRPVTSARTSSSARRSSSSRPTTRSPRSSTRTRPAGRFGVRERRDPRLSRREDRQALGRVRPRTYKALEWLNWQKAASARCRPARLLRHPGRGEVAARDLALHRRSRAAARRDRTTARRKPLSRRAELHDRRHRRLPVDATPARPISRRCSARAGGEPAIWRWLEAVGAREAVQRGMAAPKV